MGKVKTRLAASIGNRKALHIYRALLEYTRKLCESISAERYLYYSDFINKHDEWSSDLFRKRLQSQDNLGKRMQSAFEEVQADQRVIIGSDCPQLESADINQAFEALETYDLVVGPANDGGYYLLGMNELHQELFQNIAWSTEQVFEQTISQAKALNLKVKILRELVDLDTENDLEETRFLKD